MKHHRTCPRKCTSDSQNRADPGRRRRYKDCCADQACHPSRTWGYPGIAGSSQIRKQRKSRCAPWFARPLTVCIPRPRRGVGSGPHRQRRCPHWVWGSCRRKSYPPPCRRRRQYPRLAHNKPPRLICHSRYCTDAFRVCRRPMRTSLFVQRNSHLYKKIVRSASDPPGVHRYRRRRNTPDQPLRRGFRIYCLLCCILCPHCSSADRGRMWW